MIFTTYFDESGTHEDADVAVVSGYIATAEQWERFDDEWREALDCYGLDFFHMKDFAHSRGQFDGWDRDEAERQRRFARFIDIINRNVIGSVGIAIVRSDYDGLVSPEADADIGGPYGMAANMCWLTLADVLDDTGAYGQIDYVFATGVRGRHQVQQTFDRNEANPAQKEGLRLLGLSFRAMRDFTPLQAADILAYELYQQLPRQLGLNPRERRWAIERLAGVPNEWGYPDRTELIKWVRIIEIAVNLTADQRATPEKASPRTGPMTLISVEELQARWRWWHRFRGRTDRRKRQSA